MGQRVPIRKCATNISVLMCDQCDALSPRRRHHFSLFSFSVLFSSVLPVNDDERLMRCGFLFLLSAVCLCWQLINKYSTYSGYTTLKLSIFINWRKFVLR